MFSRGIIFFMLVQVVPYFLTGFVCFGLLRFIFNKVNLDNKEALGKEFADREHSKLVGESVFRA